MYPQHRLRFRTLGAFRRYLFGGDMDMVHCYLCLCDLSASSFVIGSTVSYALYPSIPYLGSCLGRWWGHVAIRYDR